MNFEVPLVTDMTPVDPPPGGHGGAGGAAGGGGGGGKRYNAITQGWTGNDDEHPEVSSVSQCCQIAKLDPFLSLDCARVEGVGAQSKERKGSNFAAQRSGAIVQKPSTTRWTRR